jgi:hypothetical protein
MAHFKELTSEVHLYDVVLGKAYSRKFSDNGLTANFLDHEWSNYLWLPDGRIFVCGLEEFSVTAVLAIDQSVGHEPLVYLNRMNYPRTTHGIACVLAQIYVFGSNDSSTWRTAESYPLEGMNEAHWE